jgi:hypothetical protein
MLEERRIARHVGRTERRDADLAAPRRSDLANSVCRSYLHRDTGDTVTLTEEQRIAAERDDDPEREENLPDWERASLAVARAVAESDRYLQLPDTYDVHEWSIMEAFAEGRPRPSDRDDLLDAIHGRGAFRMFRSAIRRLRIEDEWYRFRGNALQAIARRWLEAHGISYREPWRQPNS